MQLSELARYPGVILLVGCWLSMALVLVLVQSGLWAGPAKVDYPSRSKVTSDAEFQVELTNHKRWQAFQRVGEFASAGLGAFGVVALGLYFRLTSSGDGVGSQSVRAKSNLLVIGGVIVSYASPLAIGFSVWQYLTL